MSKTPTSANLVDNAKYKKTGYLDERKSLEQKLILQDNPDMPEGMTAGAEKIWNETLALYDRLYETSGMKVVCVLDQSTLKSYCICRDILDKLYLEYKQDENVYKTIVTKSKSSSTSGERKTGTEKRVINPVFAEINKYETRLTKLAAELCLTPAGRARMGIAILQGSKNNDLDDFLES